MKRRRGRGAKVDATGTAIATAIAMAMAGCERATSVEGASPFPPRAAATPAAVARSAAEPAPRSASAPALAPSAPSAPSVAASAPALPRRDPSELPGRTFDYAYDASDVKDRTRAYVGRAFIHDRAAAAKGPLPLVVFLHGLNRELIPHRWMGGGSEGDVRRIVSGLIDEGAIPPVLLAGPGSVEPAAVSKGASFPAFDLDRFVELTEASLDGTARVDRSKVVVLGHSGAGCSQKGGLVAAARAKSPPLAVVSIDTCMMAPLAEALGGAPASTHVVVTWQTASWKRGFSAFRVAFERAASASPPSPGVLRELDALPALPRAHDATVGQTLEKWLPRILPPR